MEHWALIELYQEARMAEGRPRKAEPVPPAGEGLWARSRRNVAQALVWLGVHLDARASQAAARRFEPAARLNGGDA